MTRLVCLLAICLGGASVAGAALDQNAVARAAEYSAKYRESALIVWEDGRIVCERNSSRAVSAPRVYSITKSLVSLGVFRDVAGGGLSLEHPVCGGARGAILSDLLNQTSGLPPSGAAFYGAGLKDKQRVLRGLKKSGAPGHFAYGPSHWEALGEELRLHRDMPVEKWIRRFVPGATSSVLARWRRDDCGVLFFSTGARMSARELLPVGREVLRGMRKGGWTEEIRTRLANGTAANRMYALGFWLNAQNSANGAREVEVESVLGREHPAAFWRGKCLSLAAPRDLLAMIGTAGQRVYVIPSRNLIVIRLGARPGFSDAEFLGRLFGRR